MKLFKTKVYRVTYTNTGGADHFSGGYIMGQEWLMTMLQKGTAKAELKR